MSDFRIEVRVVANDTDEVLTQYTTDYLEDKNFVEAAGIVARQFENVKERYYKEQEREAIDLMITQDNERI